MFYEIAVNGDGSPIESPISWMTAYKVTMTDDADD